jgi:hypothetical protein
MPGLAWVKAGALKIAVASAFILYFSVIAPLLVDKDA